MAIRTTRWSESGHQGGNEVGGDILLKMDIPAHTNSHAGK